MKRKPEESWETIKQKLAIKNLEERIAKIAENPALYGPEFGLSNEEQEVIEKEEGVPDEVKNLMNLATKSHIEEIVNEAIRRKFQDKDNDPNSNHPQK